MYRPAGVTALALVFFLFGALVFGVGVVILISPQALSSAFTLLRGLEMGGPYMALLVGAVWALIGWGLFGLRDWARLAAMM
jgi:phosphate/sulfate permease